MSESLQVRYHDPILQGESLVETAVDIYTIDREEWLVRWYHSSHDADLMVWFDSKGDVGHFQLNVGGQIVDWSRSTGVQSGFIVEIELGHPDAAETIKFDSAISLSNMRAAEAVLKNAIALKKPVREHLLSSLQDVRGQDVRKSMQSSRTRFWSRFKRWTKPAA